MTEYKRYDGESDEELIYRITGEKDNIGSWQGVADILNKLLGTEYTESKFRKQRQSFDKMFAANQNKFYEDVDVLNEIKNQRKELEKEKIRFRDERNEYNRVIRQEARKESYLDLVKRTIAEYVPKSLDYQYNEPYKSDTDMVLLISDVHCGIEINHFLNSYNEDIMAERFKKCLDNVITIQSIHHSENLNILLSEVISGLIHENLRCENNQNIIEQFLTVCKYISDFIVEVSKYFSSVNVYVAPGNHSRLNARKESSLKGENADNLIIPYLKAVLQNIKNVHCFENNIDESIAMFNIRGNLVNFVHGDKDCSSSVVQNLTLQYGVCPKIVYMGHRHKNSMETVYNTKVISAGCWSGVDNYAIDKRLNTNPETVLSIINNNGLVCNYDIKLN
jgi:hypothetical protein